MFQTEIVEKIQAHILCSIMIFFYGAEENIWTSEGRGNGGMEEIAQRGPK